MGIAILGIDPGLVHTGCVAFGFLKSGLDVQSQAFENTIDANGKRDVTSRINDIKMWAHSFSAHPHIFIEAYRSRGNNYNTDPKMRTMEHLLRLALPEAEFVDNTGVKQVVRQPLMERLGVWRFAQTTHHQDLRSAARIGIYGALKDDDLNRVLYDYLTAGGA